MEEKLIEAINKLTNAVTELNTSVKNASPITQSHEFYELTVDFKNTMLDLKISNDRLIKAMEEND